MNHSYLALVALLPIIILFPGTAFAENPTPYDEWDFDIVSERFAVTQNSDDPEIMEILIPIQYKGQFPTGTTNVYVLVTDPSGEDHSLFGQTRDLNIGQTQPMDFKMRMSLDGIYTVHASLKSPSSLHQNWPFDSETRMLEIGKDGMLERLDTRGEESGLITTYFLGDTTEIRYDEVVHAKISLPENHNYEKIALVDGDFVKEYSTDVTDIYIDGQSDYDGMKVKLVQYGNLLQMADAQETLQEYVVFYVMDRDDCSRVLCVQTDLVSENQIVQLEMIMMGLFVASLVVVIGYAIRKRPDRAYDDYSSNNLKNNDSIKNRDGEIKRYFSPIK